MIDNRTWDIDITVKLARDIKHSFSSTTNSMIIDEVEKRGVFSYQGLIGANINIDSASTDHINVSIRKNNIEVFNGTPKGFVVDYNTVDFECLMNGDFSERWNWSGSYNEIYFPEINNL